MDIKPKRDIEPQTEAEVHRDPSRKYGWTDYRTFPMRQFNEGGNWISYFYRMVPGDYEIRVIPQAITERRFEMVVREGELVVTHVDTGRVEVRTAPWTSWEQSDRSIPAGTYRIEATQPSHVICLAGHPHDETINVPSKEDSLTYIQDLIDRGLVR